MSLRVGNGSYVAGSLTVSSNGGLGMLGVKIPSTGTHGPAIPYPSLTVADDGVEIQALFTTYPTATSGPGTLTSFFAYEDGSFEALVTANCELTGAWTLKKDGVLDDTNLVFQVPVGNTASGIGTSIGTAIVTGDGSSIAETVAASAGSSTANGFSSSALNAVGQSSGTSAAAAIGASQVGSTGTSVGRATLEAFSQSASNAFGVSAGTSTAEAFSQAGAGAAGLSVGLATVTGIGLSFNQSTGTSVGTSTAHAEGSQVATGEAIGVSVGKSTVNGYTLMPSANDFRSNTEKKLIRYYQYE